MFMCFGLKLIGSSVITGGCTKYSVSRFTAIQFHNIKICMTVCSNTHKHTHTHTQREREREGERERETHMKKTVHVR